ncbi:cyclin-J18-like [Curcuma longa]|uniref:cyclin-J18-like n=1 Tax=Curcuma longa TaxID=136217 RepID=UPI003D9E2A0A
MEIGRWCPPAGSSSSYFSSCSISPSLRHRLVEFLLHATSQLQCRPIVKYTALTFFVDRFLPSLCRKAPSLEEKDGGSWLLRPVRESNLQLFSLASIWISNKIHDSSPFSVKSLKALGDKLITDQHFTTKDFVEAELVFMEVSGYDIGASSIAFIFLEDLLIQFRTLSKLGEHVSLDASIDILDLLYETEETSMLFTSPCLLASAVLIAAYVICVPKQCWEFPLIPWVKFVTNYSEEEIAKTVAAILVHVLKPEKEK